MIIVDSSIHIFGFDYFRWKIISSTEQNTIYFLRVQVILYLIKTDNCGMNVNQNI